MKAKLLLSFLIFFTCSQLFAIHSESGQFFGEPADLKIKISELQNSSLSKPAFRPDRDFQYTSPEGYFIIHYDTTGTHAVPQDYNYHASIPDFVFKAAEYLDESYIMLHDSLGFKAPRVDDVESPELDVYFKNTSQYYGQTYYVNNDGNGAYVTYLHLSTQLNDSTIFYTHGLEGLRVTCAHELFHMFQLGYKLRTNDVFYFEMSSVWFEEYMYPEVNDYHSYMQDYSEQWKYAIHSSSLDYNNVGFNMYIDKRFSTNSANIIKKIWDRILTMDALDAIRTELESRGITFEEALRGWGTAQVLCGPYSADNFAYEFNDASELPSVSFNNYEENIVDDLEEDIGLVSDPGVFYYKLTDLPENVFLFDMTITEGSNASLICLDDSHSVVKHFTGSPLIIDGNQFRECILVIGLDANNASGSMAVTELYKNQLANIWPNPLDKNDELSIAYVLLEESSKAQLSIYDLSGRKHFSRQLSTDLKRVGLQELSLRPQNLASGVYIISLHTDAGVVTGKFTIIK